jgi:hypothetical protein
LIEDVDSTGSSLNSLASTLKPVYAKQAYLIDTGQHRDWAKTFLPEGEFHSPTYSKPAVGHDALVDISRAFATAAQDAGEIHRHIVTNLWVVEADQAVARTCACLLILASSFEAGTARILRVVTLHDKLVWDGGQWLISYRHISHEPNA